MHCSEVSYILYTYRDKIGVLDTVFILEWQPYHIYVPIVKNAGSLDVLEPSEPI